MDLTLILGPMKSGKSFEMISYFSPLKYTEIPFEVFQSIRNVRDENIWTRNGLQIKATKIKNISDILKKDLQVIGIDEVHMFPEEDAETINELLKRNVNVKVIASGLDMDYRGKIFKIIKRLFELGPKEVKYKRAVCELCKKPDAVYTQVLKNNIPILEGLPAVIPEDGTYSYKPVCRNCFRKK